MASSEPTDVGLCTTELIKWRNPFWFLICLSFNLISWSLLHCVSASTVSHIILVPIMLRNSFSCWKKRIEIKPWSVLSALPSSLGTENLLNLDPPPLSLNWACHLFVMELAYQVEAVKINKPAPLAKLKKSTKNLKYNNLLREAKEIHENPETPLLIA